MWQSLGSVGLCCSGPSQFSEGKAGRKAGGAGLAQLHIYLIFLLFRASECKWHVWPAWLQSMRPNSTCGWWLTSGGWGRIDFAPRCCHRSWYSSCWAFKSAPHHVCQSSLSFIIRWWAESKLIWPDGLIISVYLVSGLIAGFGEFPILQALHYIFGEYVV